MRHSRMFGHVVECFRGHNISSFDLTEVNTSSWIADMSTTERALSFMRVLRLCTTARYPLAGTWSNTIAFSPAVEHDRVTHNFAVDPQILVRPAIMHMSDSVQQRRILGRFPRRRLVTLLPRRRLRRANRIPMQRRGLIYLTHLGIFLDILVCDAHGQVDGLFGLAHQVHGHEQARGPVDAVFVLVVESEGRALVAGCPDHAEGAAAEHGVMEPSSFGGESFSAIGVFDCGLHGGHITLLAWNSRVAD